jgi:hypothetical protein
MQAPAQVRSRAENRRSIDNPIRPSQPNGEETIYGGLPSGYKATEASAFASAARHRGESADFRGSRTPGSSVAAPTNVGEDKAMAKAETHRAGAGYPEGVRMPQDYTFTNPNGVQQTVKKMSGGVSAAFVPEYANSSFNDLLAGVMGKKAQPFSSNQLPTTGANPFEGTAPKTDGFNPAAPGVTGNDYDNYAAAGGAAAVKPGANAESAAFNPDAARIEGGSSRKPGGSLAEALADKDGINSYMSKFSDGDRERMARRAFLDADDSMSGLRAKEAVNGVVYAGGKHYVSGKSGDDAAIGIDRSDARNISSGKAKAQDFANKKVAETVAATKQSPAVLEEGAKNGAFQQDKPMFSGSTPAIEGAVEFDNNNSQTLPTFGAPKGYKSQATKIGATGVNPFG